MYVTPRTLLAIIRLAQAMAKLQFRNEVKQIDVDEAIKLMDYSIRSLRNVKGQGERRKESKFIANNSFLREGLEQGGQDDSDNKQCEGLDELGEN